MCNESLIWHENLELHFVVISETFSFVLTEIDGSRRNGYCRRLLVSVCSAVVLDMDCEVCLTPFHLQPGGKGARAPEAYCIISTLACFGLFSKVSVSPLHSWMLSMRRWPEVARARACSEHFVLCACRFLMRWRSEGRSPWPWSTRSCRNWERHHSQLQDTRWRSRASSQSQGQRSECAHAHTLTHQHVLTRTPLDTSVLVNFRLCGWTDREKF